MKHSPVCITGLFETTKRNGKTSIKETERKSTKTEKSTKKRKKHKV